MNILFISTSIPPCQDSQTIRNFYLINGLLNNGDNVDIITGAFDKNSNFLLDSFEEKCQIYRTNNTLIERLSIFNKQIFSGKILNFLNSGFAVFSGWFGIPDNKGDWYFLAKKLIKSKIINQDKSYDFVISSAGCFSSHLVASWYVGKCNNNITFLAEYGDPWSYSVLKPASFWHIKFFNRILEKRVMKKVSCITVTTKETKDLFELNFSNSNKPIQIYLIPCGFRELNNCSIFNFKSCLNVGYIGTAFKGSRNLLSFIDLFESISLFLNGEISFNKYIVGSFSESFKTYVFNKGIENVNFTGWVSYDKSIEYTNDLDILILYGNKSPYQVPAKVFNYLASLKPIIYFSQIELDLDPTWRIIKDFEGVVLFNPSCEASFKSLVNHIINYEDLLKVANSRKFNPELHKYKWDSLSKEFSSIVHSYS